jgi:hypothetical protein
LISAAIADSDIGDLISISVAVPPRFFLMTTLRPSRLASQLFRNSTSAGTTTGARLRVRAPSVIASPAFAPAGELPPIRAAAPAARPEGLVSRGRARPDRILRV